MLNFPPNLYALADADKYGGDAQQPGALVIGPDKGLTTTP